MKTLLRYDLLYMKRTTKIIIMLAVGAFIAFLSILTARYMNELMAMAFEQEGIEGITLPDPTVEDAYIQFYSNMQQIFFLVYLFIAGAFFSRDFTKGTDHWMFARPVSKFKYLMSRTLVVHALGVVSLLTAGVFFLYGSYFLFPEVDTLRFLASLVVFYVFVLFFTQMLLALVTLFGRMLWPMLITIAMLFVLGIFSGIEAGAFKYIPSRLGNYAMELLLHEATIREVTIAAGIGLLSAALFTVLSVLLLNKQCYTK